MVQQFKDITTRPIRAFQAWLILIAQARNQQTLTYSTLDELMKFGNPRALGAILDYIWAYCRANDLPPLTSIVVAKTTGVPSNSEGDLDFAQKEAVFEFDWYSIVPPSPSELDASHKKKPSD